MSRPLCRGLPGSPRPLLQVRSLACPCLHRCPRSSLRRADVGGIRLDEVNSVEELLAVDPKLLKEALEARGLKCGCVSDLGLPRGGGWWMCVWGGGMGHRA